MSFEEPVKLLFKRDTKGAFLANTGELSPAETMVEAMINLSLPSVCLIRQWHE